MTCANLRKLLDQQGEIVEEQRKELEEAQAALQEQANMTLEAWKERDQLRDAVRAFDARMQGVVIPMPREYYAMVALVKEEG